VSAIEVVVWLFTAACHSPSPGMEAMFCNQYVTRLNTIAPTSDASSNHVIAVNACHTER